MWQECMMVVVILNLAQISGIRLPEVKVVIVFASKHSCLGWPAHFLLVVPIKISTIMWSMTSL